MRIGAAILGMAGAVAGAAAAVASVFAPGGPEFTVVRESLAAGLLALAFAIVSGIGAGEAVERPRLGGSLMLLGAVGGFASIRTDFGIAPGLLTIAAVVALVSPRPQPRRRTGGLGLSGG